MDFTSVTDLLGGFYEHWSSLVSVILIIIAVLIVNRALHWLLKVLGKRHEPAERPWLDAFFWSADAPVRAIVWVIGLTVAVNVLTKGLDVEVLDNLFPPARNVVAILVVGWYFMRVVHRIEKNLHARSAYHREPVDATAADAIGKLAHAVIIIVVALVVMQTLGFSIGGLLAFGGAAGIAIGFAAQTLVANLLGGLTVYASRIFKIGDDIIVPGTTLAGTVHEIGWRATRVVGWDGKPFYVPNSLFNSSSMVNHSRLVRRSFSEDILLRYQEFDKVRDIVREGNELLAKRDDLNYFVFRFSGFGEAALKLNIYAWPQTVPAGRFLPYAEFGRIKEEVLLSIVDIARKHGCELMLPVSNLYLRGGWPSDSGGTTPNAETAQIESPPEPGEDREGGIG